MLVAATSTPGIGDDLVFRQTASDIVVESPSYLDRAVEAGVASVAPATRRHRLQALPKLGLWPSHEEHVQAERGAREHERQVGTRSAEIATEAAFEDLPEASEVPEVVHGLKPEDVFGGVWFDALTDYGPYAWQDRRPGPALQRGSYQWSGGAGRAGPWSGRSVVFGGLRAPGYLRAGYGGLP